MIRPLGDRILVARLEAEEKTPGGIVIPDIAKDKPQLGDVQAVGPGRLLDDGTVHPVSVKAGDRVLFNKYGGAEVEIDGKKLIVMREDDILDVVEPAASSVAPSAHTGPALVS